jgi:hypothetical protein
MMCVASDGYIIDATGLYFSDYHNNDAQILKKMLQDPDSIMGTLVKDDALVLDRGFRDAKNAVINHGLKFYMPELLKKNVKQFTSEQANKSRQVTHVRCIVEQVNGRIKQFHRFFDHVIPAKYFPKLNRLFQLCCSMLNAFSPPLFVETDFHVAIAERIVANLHKENDLQKRVEELGLCRKTKPWIRADEDCLLEFPALSYDEIKLITLGTFQLDNGDGYNRQHLDVNGYKYLLHKELPGLIQVQLHSRFRRKIIHHTFVQFTEHGTGPDSIEGYYCTCQSGARTLGCCSHVAAVSNKIFGSHDVIA